MGGMRIALVEPCLASGIEESESERVIPKGKEVNGDETILEAFERQERGECR